MLEELDVVDQEHVVGAVALLEPLDPLVAQRVDEVVHERLGGDVADREVERVPADVVRDRVQQMRLAEPRVAVDEERVVGLRRRLGDRERSGVREAVRRADHERVEGVLRVDRAAVDPRRPAASAPARHQRGRSSGPPARLDDELDAAARSPVASLMPARISSAKRPSIQSRVKSFGTARTNVVASSRDRRRPRRSSVRKVFSLSAPRKRADTSLQRLSAVSSVGVLHASSALLRLRSGGDE